MNKIFISGRMTKDAEVKAVGETSVMKFTVASERRVGKEKKTDFIDCDYFCKSAANLAEKVGKGNRVDIWGELNIDEFTDKNGNKRTKPVIRVDELAIIDWKDNSGKADKPQSDDAGYDDEDEELGEIG